MSYSPSPSHQILLVKWHASLGHLGSLNCFAYLDEMVVFRLSSVRPFTVNTSLSCRQLNFRSMGGEFGSNRAAWLIAGFLGRKFMKVSGRQNSFAPSRAL